VASLVNQNYEVDYYLSLTTDVAGAYRGNSPYMARLRWDPVFDEEDAGSLWNQSTPVPPNDRIRKVVQQEISKAGGHVAAFHLAPSIDIDSSKLLAARRNDSLLEALNMKQLNALRMDRDTWFPVWDTRSKARMEATAIANQNLLRLHLAVSMLWMDLTAVEEREDFVYDRVVFLRDDTFWVEDFDLDGLLKVEGDVHVLACDARVPPMAPSEMNDHGLIVARKFADLFGKYYEKLFQTNLTACRDSLPPKLHGYDRNKGPTRGCNSEMILKWILEHADGIRIRTVGQGKIPFQRGAHVDLGNGKVETCFHKYCQSREDPLDDPDHRTCSSLDSTLLRRMVDAPT
jgi:hypothetical protein